MVHFVPSPQIAQKLFCRTETVLAYLRIMLLAVRWGGDQCLLVYHAGPMFGMLKFKSVFCGEEDIILGT